MKTFDVVLTKSYVVRIKAENENSARELTEFYTSNIKDLSTENNRQEHNFIIENIDCKINETFDITEVNENN